MSRSRPLARALALLVATSVAVPHAFAQTTTPAVPGIYGLEALAAPEAAPAPEPAAAPVAKPAAKPSKVALDRALTTKPASFERFSAGVRALKAKKVSLALAELDRLPANSVEARTLAWAIALYGAGAPALHIARVTAAQPNWPGQTTLRTNMEWSIIRQNPNGQSLRVAFANAEPRTSTGRIALARAELAAGNRKTAAKLVRKVWRDADLSPQTEARVLKDFGRLLTRDDHQTRVERLIAKKRVKGATRLAGKAGYTRLVAAAGAVVRKRSDRNRRLDAVPRSQRGEPLYQLFLARSRRLSGRLTGAAEAIAGMKRPRSGLLGDMAANEAYRIAIELLHVGKTKLAYQVAKLDLGERDTRRAAAAFQAGWIALRYRNAPRVADGHFKRLEKIAERPISMSRAAYWRGRVASAEGRDGDAAAFYKKAARWKTTFYGQLAAERLGRTSLGIARTRPTDTDRKRFKNYELVRALKLLERAGAKSYARPLYSTLAKRLEQPGEVAILAARHEKRGDHRSALVVGKLASARGMVAPSLSHPLGAITGSIKLSKSDLALAYGVARQESAFQQDARSRADALGLMQLLPGTAKQVSRQVGLRYARAKLTRDPAYNVRLGTTYLRQNRKRLGGSLPLALVAYNAGPTRAKNWSAEFGNPGTMSLEKAIDWVEQIPFNETRNYVQKVMSNHQVYRARILGSKPNLGALLTAG